MAAKHLQLTEELQELASLFAAGALPEQERIEYVRHLEEDDCAVCRNEARELQSAASLISLRLPMATPSPRAKERLMERVRSSVAVAPVPIVTPIAQPRRWFPWASGLAAVAATVALLFVLNDNTRLRRMTDSLSSRVAQLEEQLSGERARLASLTSPRVRVVNLAGQGQNAGASGRVFWDQSRRRWLFYAQNLQMVSSDKSYQLWFVPAAGNPVSASVFNTDSNGATEFEVPVPENLTQIKAAAVTTEPFGGLPQPSGAFALLGALD
jgi:anti-sigma-K factor RskA